MADKIDDLLRAADRGVPVGTTQRYFKGAPQPAPQPPPAPAPKPAEAAPANESEKDYIDRIMGRKKQSMSDVDARPVAGQQYAQADTAATAPTAGAPARKMAKFEVTTPDGKTFEVTAPEGTPSDQVLRTVYAEAQKLGMYKPEPVAKTPEGQGVLDWLKRQQAKNEAARAQLEPSALKTAREALPSAVTAATLPLTAGGGTLAAKVLPQVPRLAAAGGRALTQGVIGGVEAGLEGRSPLKAGAMDTATSLLTEGGLSLAPHLARIPGLTKSIATITEELGSRNKAYDYATKAIGQAFKAVEDRIPPGRWMSLPSVDKTRKLTAKEAQAGLEKLEGVNYEVARKEILSELNRLDIRNIPRRMGGPGGPRPYAGQEFEMRTSPQRFKPTATTGEKVAAGATNTLKDPFLRAATDTALTQNKVEGVPFGALAGATMAQSLPILRHMPGGRLLDQLTDETIE